MNIYLHRFKQDAAGTFGLLVLDNKPLCVTCEDPWNDNQNNISCVPEGTYQCVAHNGAKYKNVWRLENVPGREAVLIHNGNTISNTEGCILVGEKLGYLAGRQAILNSVVTLNKLREILPSNFTLTITNLLKG